MRVTVGGRQAGIVTYLFCVWLTHVAYVIASTHEACFFPFRGTPHSRGCLAVVTGDVVLGWMGLAKSGFG